MKFCKSVQSKNEKCMHFKTMLREKYLQAALSCAVANAGYKLCTVDAAAAAASTLTNRTETSLENLFYVLCHAKIERKTSGCRWEWQLATKEKQGKRCLIQYVLKTVKKNAAA